MADSTVSAWRNEVAYFVSLVPSTQNCSDLEKQKQEIYSRAILMATDLKAYTGSTFAKDMVYSSSTSRAANGYSWFRSWHPRILAARIEAINQSSLGPEGAGSPGGLATGEFSRIQASENSDPSVRASYALFLRRQ